MTWLPKTWSWIWTPRWTGSWPAAARLAVAVAALTTVGLLAASGVADPGPDPDPAHRYWPQWRGPAADGVAPHADPPVTWSETENVRWKVEIPGRGHSSPVVWGDRVFLLTAVESRSPEPAREPEPASDPGDGAEPQRRRGFFSPVTPEGALDFVVMAFDRATGEVVWQRTARTAVPHEGTHTDGTWASASPVTDGRHVWASFGSQGIYCYTFDGKKVWERDLGDMHTRNGFGEGSSPALHGDSLVINWDHEGDSFIVALDAGTGEERWRRSRDEITSWATPVVVEAGGRPQVVVNATGKVRAYDLAGGELLWETGGMTVNTIPSPVHGDGVVYVTSGFRGNALKAIRVAAAKGDVTGTDAVAWTWDRDTPYVPSPLLYDGILYLLKHNRGILTAFDAGSGEVHYGPERLPDLQGVYASPVGAAGRVYVVGRDGTAVVLKHGPELEVLAVNRLDDGFDASPAVVDDEIFLRGRRHLYALAKAGEIPAAASPGA